MCSHQRTIYCSLLSCHTAAEGVGNRKVQREEPSAHHFCSAKVHSFLRLSSMNDFATDACFCNIGSNSHFSCFRVLFEESFVPPTVQRMETGDDRRAIRQIQRLLRSSDTPTFRRKLWIAYGALVAIAPQHSGERGKVARSHPPPSASINNTEAAIRRPRMFTAVTSSDRAAFSAVITSR